MAKYKKWIWLIAYFVMSLIQNQPINSIALDAMQFLELLVKNKRMTSKELALAFECAKDRVSKREVTLGYAGTYKKMKSEQELVFHTFTSILSEWLVAKELQIDYDVKRFNIFKNEADVGDNIEVRWTPYSNGHLKIRSNDRHDDFAVSVHTYNFVIQGWMPVSICKEEKYRYNHEYNWWIPQSELRPIDELKGILNAGRAYSMQ